MAYGYESKEKLIEGKEPKGMKATDKSMSADENYKTVQKAKGKKYPNRYTEPLAPAGKIEEKYKTGNFKDSRY